MLNRLRERKQGKPPTSVGLAFGVAFRTVASVCLIVICIQSSGWLKALFILMTSIFVLVTMAVWVGAILWFREHRQGVPTPPV